MKRILSTLLVCILAVILLCSCNQNSEQKEPDASDLYDKDSEVDSGDNTASANSGETESDITLPEPEKITFVLDWTPNTNHTGIYWRANLAILPKRV